MSPDQQTPKDTQPAPSVDDLIAQANAETYVFERTAQKRSPKEWFSALPKTRKILLISGIVSTVFITLVVGMTLVRGDGSNTASLQPTTYATTDTNGDGIIDEKDEATTVKGDTNGDGVVDSRDDAAANTTDSESASWWGNLFAKANSAISSHKSGDSSDSSDDSTSSASASDDSSSSSTISYGDDTEWYDGDGYEDEAEYDDDAMDFSSYGDADTVDETISSTVSHPIAIASWNTLYSNSTGNIKKGTKAVSQKADIIGFQEFHFPAQRKAMRDAILCSSCEFTGYVKDYSTSGHSPSSIAIVWRKSRFTKLDAGYRKVSSAQRIKTKTGITGSKISSKWITWVKLRDKQTGNTFYMMNTHTVASLESKGKPVGSEDDRVDNYIHHMDVLTNQINKLKADGIPIFITGDFNVNYRYDSRVKYKNFPYSRLRALGIRSDYQRLNLAGISKSTGSHGKGTRIIDYVWALDSPKLVSSSIAISSARYGSDHSPAYYTFGLK